MLYRYFVDFRQVFGGLDTGVTLSRPLTAGIIVLTLYFVNVNSGRVPSIF